MSPPITMKQEAEAKKRWREEKAFEVMREFIRRDDFNHRNSSTIVNMSIIMTDKLIEKLEKPQ
ncbi:hypothetical protein ACS8E3_07845 [Psychrobacter sp. 2Y5]|uniref:hypothetical protein n=1 Tax=unclassified Psychrobacter TaxID=196806 RepID=UPI003F46A3A1